MVGNKGERAWVVDRATAGDASPNSSLSQLSHKHTDDHDDHDDHDDQLSQRWRFMDFDEVARAIYI